jgi:hypothetical protein
VNTVAAEHEHWGHQLVTTVAMHQERLERGAPERGAPAGGGLRDGGRQQ